MKRKFGVYVVVAKGGGKVNLYIGKVGDNREGCNPVVSRCGNHFSYNEVHSQVRNKLKGHENWSYTYVFDHFAKYTKAPAKRRAEVERINEMERWLNQMIQELVQPLKRVTVLNRFGGKGYVPVKERKRRASFRTKAAASKLRAIVDEVKMLVVE